MLRLKSGRHIQIKSKLGSVIADEKSHKDGKNVKGAAGRMVCSACKNIHSLDSVVDDGVFFHYKTAMPAQFKIRSDSEFYEVCDFLDAQFPVTSEKEFAEIEKNMGVNRDVDSLIWCKELRDVFGPVSTLYIDWMHTIPGSGGIAQYHLNSFIAELQTSTGATCADLDEFGKAFYASLVRAPGHRKLSGDFFKKRVVHTENQHIKAFAAECLLAIQLLVVYCRERLDPTRTMSDHSYALRILAAIVDILSLRDKAVEHVGKLKELMERHHKLFLILYGSSVAKPKIHLVHHVPMSLEQHKVLLDCFSCERRLKLLRAAHKNCAGRDSTAEYCTRRLVMDLAYHIEHATCHPFALKGKICMDPQLAPEFAEFGRVSAVSVAKSASSPLGLMRQNTFVAVQWRNSVKTVLKCVNFADVRFVEEMSTPHIFIFGSVFVERSGGIWHPTGSSAYFEAAMLSDVLSVQKRDFGSVSPLWRSFDV